MENKTQERKFGLITTVSMIIGIVIGSGIFFKTPQIIQATNGNILVGAIAFLLAAFSIIFGGLTIAQYSKLDDSIGGIVSYLEAGYNRTIAYLAGWFQVSIYYPCVIAVVIWVVSNYTLALFGQDNILTTGNFNHLVWPLAVIYMIILYLLNSLKTKKAGHFQDLAMFCKLSALIVFTISGLIWGKPSTIITSSTIQATSANVMSALVAVAFAFDGWMIAPSIAHEIKNPQKNLTLALIFAPLGITIIYLAYYFSMSCYAPSDIIIQGIDPIGLLANDLFGNLGMKIVYIFVIISVLGTANGVILGYIRLPYALALRNELPFSKALSKINLKYDIPLNSAIFCFTTSLFFLFLHYLSLDGALLIGLEIDNLPIVVNYIFLILMYLAVLTGKIKTKTFLQGKLYPILAIIGALIVLFAGFTKPNFNTYIIICCTLILFGLLIRPKKNA